ncbi:MAG: glycoside hydrolase family 3 C-terminal domain-containing protein [Prevotella sp.]|nr:glycoside hydrolase family 3 C-terminal domain-containing protein [Prevotella sp.]
MKKIILTITILLGAITVGAQQYPYQNPNLSPEERAEDLLKRLTLEEKVKLMMNSSPAIERLGIPQFEWWNEALHGVGRNGFVTVFPITMSMASSWNDALVQDVFTATSDEARAKNQEAKARGVIKKYQGLSFWTPNINIFRDPRWGRGQETYGEDPYLTTKMGLAVVRGLEGPKGSKYRKLLSCAKHYAVHSGPEWNRHSFNMTNLPERDLWETYMPAFKALVQEGDVAEVMCAYQRNDGDPCCGNTRYEQQILRDEWGFKGLIVSDCGAVSDFWQKGKHEVSKDAASASARAVLSGTDVECGRNYNDLPEAVRRGEIKESDIDVSVRRLLISRFIVGDMTPDELVEWTKIPSSVIASQKHKDIAYKIAQQGTVLLQNSNNILPLGKDQGNDIVVMGANANDSVMMWGNYCGFPTKTVTILEGIRNKVGNVKYVPGCGLTNKEVLFSKFAGFVSPDGKKGMRATYWNNVKKEGTPVTTLYITEPMNLSNGGATVYAPGVEFEHFSALYEGSYTPEKDETLTIKISCDDRGIITLNGDTIINVKKKSDKLGIGSKDLKLKAGVRYDIVVDYIQDDDMATLQFDFGKMAEPTDEEILAQVGNASTIIYVGGISPRLEGEEMKVNAPGFKGGDRTSIELPQAQRDMIAMLKKAGKKVIFINCSGSAMAMEPETANCEAIVQAWYGGERGGEAVADILFGDYNPSGKLPITFYKSDKDLPDYEDYKMTNRTYRYFQGEPLFCFGHGLSYTTFEFGKPKYDKKNGKLIVNVKNSGSKDGEEVVQVYIKKCDDAEGPSKTLRAYKRVSLKAGESKNVKIDLPRDSFEWWDKASNTMCVKPGKFDVMVGNSSASSNLKSITVKVK